MAFQDTAVLDQRGPPRHERLPDMPPLLINTLSTEDMQQGGGGEGGGGADLVSVLLERGNKLKQKMEEATTPTTPEDLLDTYGSVFSPAKM